MCSDILDWATPVAPKFEFSMKKRSEYDDGFGLFKRNRAQKLLYACIYKSRIHVV